MSRYIIYILFLFSFGLQGQNLFQLQSGKVNFFAGTVLEDIEANNVKATSFLSRKTGEVTISIPIKEFHFKRALMEEHFNENYLESDKYPKAEFNGIIENISQWDSTASVPFKTTVKGILKIHGIAKERSIEITLLTKNNEIIGDTKFPILLSDHNIDRPKIVWEKLAEKVDVTARFIYVPYQK